MFNKKASVNAPAEGAPMTPAEAADSVIKLGRTFQALIDVAKELARVGSIQQAEAEANALLVKARAELELVSGNITSEREVLEVIRDQIEAAKAEMRAFEITRGGWADSIKEHEADIETLVKRKEAEIERTVLLVKEAEDRAQEAADEASKVRAHADKIMMEAHAMHRKADRDVGEMNEKIAAGKVELAAIEEKIAAAKEQISKVFGGFGAAI